MDDPVRDWDKTMWLENAIDFLDESEEWVVNTRERKIFYWPAGERPEEGIVAPKLKELIQVKGEIDQDSLTDVPVKNIVFKGLTFTQGDAYRFSGHFGYGLQHDWEMYDEATALLRFRGAEDCVVEECHFVNSGGTGIRLDLYCQGILIKNNLIEHIGNIGILLAGYGPGTKDVNKGNTIVNNNIYHTGQVYWHGHGILIWQSGDNWIAHNYIHNCPRKAIAISGVRPYSFDLQNTYHSHSESAKLIRWSELPERFRSLDYDKVTQEDWKYFVPFMHSRDNLIV